MQGRPAQTKQVRGVSPGFPVAAALADVGEPGPPGLIVSAVAAAVMLGGALILRGDPGEDDGGEDLNVKAVLLDTVGDAAAAGGVAVSGAIILGTGWYWLDPATALAIAVIVGYHAQKLTRTIIAALRSPSPAPTVPSAPSPPG
jgi:Co/Zn/Cd efflux system component